MLHNCHYLFEGYYQSKPTEHMKALLERELVLNHLRDDVLWLCMNSSVCKQLNMSFNELLDLDYDTYQKVKELVEKRDDETRRQQLNIAKKQDGIMKEVKNAKANARTAARL